MSVSHHGLKWLCRGLRGSNLVEGGQGDLSLRYISSVLFRSYLFEMVLGKLRENTGERQSMRILSNSWYHC